MEKHRSEAVAKSWRNPKVKAARSRRDHVKVSGKEYRSVREAFVQLKLPLSQHQPFRRQLKAAGVLKAYDRTWRVVPTQH
jgi:hypothetical protein